MTMLRFDITKILTEVFGGAYVGNEFPGIDAAQKPVEQEAIADGLNHQGPGGVWYMMPLSINDWQLPLEPAIAISGSKKIVQTSLAGNKRRGSVKEIINTNDYAISIRGLIINEMNDNYPFDDVERLKELFEIDESVKITNALTKLWGIENIVITSVSLPEMTGRPNIQAYQLNCVSDEDFVLIKDY